MKKCLICKESKHEEFFYKDSSRKDGQSPRCKNCERLMLRERRQKHKAVFSKKDRNYYQKHKEITLAKRKEDYVLNKNKIQARGLVKTAISNGKLKKMACEKCGDRNVAAHHPDYSKPLEVVWLCPQCHMQLHHGKNPSPHLP